MVTLFFIHLYKLKNKDMIEKFIDRFISQVSSPNQLLFALILTNKFGGDVLVNDSEDLMPDIISLIDNKLYDAYGLIEDGLVDINDYEHLDKMSLLFNVKFYNYAKWALAYEGGDDQLYHDDIN